MQKGLLLAAYTQKATFDAVKDKTLFVLEVPSGTAHPAADRETIKTMCAVTLADPYRTRE